MMSATGMNSGHVKTQPMVLSSLFVNKADKMLLPELFQHTTIDPSSRKRSKEMKLLVIGFARTGTMSIRAALETLGVEPTYHMMSWYTNPRDGKMWRRAIRAKFDPKSGEKPLSREEWDMLLGECEACIDAPTAAFMPELMEAYPEAKIIIAERDGKKWAKSYCDTISKSAGDFWLGNVLAPLDSYFLRDHVPMVRLLFRSVLGKAHLNDGCGGLDEANVVERYKGLHDEVRGLSDSRKVLEYSIDQGWKPLCDFLGAKEPSQPFPHINDSACFSRRQYLRKWLAVDRILLAYLPWIITIAFTLMALHLARVEAPLEVE